MKVREPHAQISMSAQSPRPNVTFAVSARTTLAPSSVDAKKATRAMVSPVSISTSAHSALPVSVISVRDAQTLMAPTSAVATRGILELAKSVPISTSARPTNISVTPTPDVSITKATMDAYVILDTRATALSVLTSMSVSWVPTTAILLEACAPTLLGHTLALAARATQAMAFSVIRLQLVPQVPVMCTRHVRLDLLVHLSVPVIWVT